MPPSVSHYYISFTIVRSPVCTGGVKSSLRRCRGGLKARAQTDLVLAGEPNSPPAVPINASRIYFFGISKERTCCRPAELRLLRAAFSEVH